MARGHVNRVCFPCTCMHCDFSCQVYKVIKFDKKPLNSGDNVVPKTNCFGLDSFGQKKVFVTLQWQTNKIDKNLVIETDGGRKGQRRTVLQLLLIILCF